MTSESFGAFTEVLNHRMGNLLTGIGGYTDLLMPGLLSAEDRETALQIHESVSRMSGMLKDLEHYRDTFTPVRGPLMATNLIHSLSGLLSVSEAEQLQVEMTPQTDIRIHADERLLLQALNAVLRNAFEASPPEPDTVTLKAVPTMDGSRVCFSVHSASFMEHPETRRRLFQPFFTTKAANLGLGLTMARRIFRAHGGDIILSLSDKELGTVFSCTLPVQG
jgi:signal transduction histidine kinase